MADFPLEWESVRELTPGGQAHTFVVNRADGSDPKLYLLKRLINPKRREYFEREIQVCMTLEHPNLLKVIEHGETPKGRPYLITEYCAGGCLTSNHVSAEPGSGLRFFRQIVFGIAYAHTHQPPVYHLDLKPENILLRAEAPVIGDFGVCFIEDGELAVTSEGQLGSRYYCPPELRGPKISATPPFATADIYSLGKLLYWLFTGDVFDGHEEDYGNVSARRLSVRFPGYPQFAFIDELVADMVRRNPADRIASAAALFDRVGQVLQRIDAGGHVLDLKIPPKCLYCATGHCRPAHENVYVMGVPQQPTFPELNSRKLPETPSHPEASMYATLRSVLRSVFYAGPHLPSSGIPLILFCDFCGNVQYFRLDMTQDGHGENWRP